MPADKKAAMIAALVLGIATVFFCQPNQAAPSCEIEINSPRENAKVSGVGEVQGTVRKPSQNAHVWILAHRKGLALWWPQPPGDVAVKDGNWVGEVYYGTPDDMGSQFEIIAVVVRDDVNAKLRQWLDKAQAAGYPPIHLPESVCHSSKTVIRTR